MFRITALLGLLYVAKASEICVGNVPGESLQGLCVPKIDCKSDEWEFGTTKNPICDEAGADWSHPETKVCCFD